MATNVIDVVIRLRGLFTPTVRSANDSFGNHEDSDGEEREKKKSTLLNKANEIINVAEETIQKRTGLNPDDIMKSFWHLLSIIYGSTVNRQRMAYKRLNQWIEESLTADL